MADRIETIDLLRLGFAFDSVVTREVRVDHALAPVDASLRS